MTDPEEECSDVAVPLGAEHDVGHGVANQSKYAHQPEHSHVEHEREQTAVDVTVVS